MAAESRLEAAESRQAEQLRVLEAKLKGEEKRAKNAAKLGRQTPSGLIATSTPLARTNGTWQQMIVFGAGGTQFAYLEPYLGSYHLFTTRLLPARGRAIR